MAALVEGEQYGLTSGRSTGADKTCVYVKLTDSALRAIEDFQKTHITATSHRPVIQLRNNEGVIKIPSKSSDSAEGFKQFRFVVSNLPGDPNGSFDCVQQSHKNQLDLVGSMPSKISVCATDDVYKATKQKMTLAEEESKKNCAKEIKPGAPNVGRKIKKVIRGGAGAIYSKNSASSNGPSHHKTSPSYTSAGTGTMGSSFRGAASVSKASSLVSKSNPALGGASGITSSSSAKSSSSNSNAAAVMTNSSNSSSSSSNSKPNSAIMALPYRDRVIHLLAVRPYKKPELLARLQKDGIKEKDKNSLGSILQQVAHFSPRENTYTLAKHLYDSVKPDWPFYTETDKQLLKRRRPHESNGTPTRSPSVSPTSTAHSPPSSQKRGSSSSISELDQPSKKQRIAHSSSKATVNGHYSPDKYEVTTTTPDSSHIKTDEENKGSSRALASSTSDTPDYILQYTMINSQEQRRRYKEDFNQQYDHYRGIHASVEKVSKKFRELQEQLYKSKPGTEEYEKIRDKIYREYKGMKNDSKYMEEKKEVDYLHTKLGHIKRLIQEYDQSLHEDS